MPPPKKEDNTEEELQAFTADDPELIELSEQWKLMRPGFDLDKWWPYMPRLLHASNWAMKAANSNDRTGGGYAKKFGKYLDHYFAGMPKSEVTALLWFGDDPTRQTKLAELRAKMSDGRRANLCLPTSARKLVERHIKPAAKPKDSNATQLAIELEKNHRLEAELAKAKQDGGSPFDLQTTSAEDVGVMLAEKFTEEEWKEIAKAVDEAYAAKRNQSSPPEEGEQP